MIIDIGAFQTKDKDDTRIEFLKENDINIFCTKKELEVSNCDLYFIHSGDVHLLPENEAFFYNSEKFKKKWKIFFSGDLFTASINKKIKTVSKLSFKELKKNLPQFIEYLKNEKPENSTLVEKDFYELIGFNPRLEASIHLNKSLDLIPLKKEDFKNRLSELKKDKDEKYKLAFELIEEDKKKTEGDDEPSFEELLKWTTKKIPELSQKS